MSPRRTGRRGFTLIEMMVVVAVVGTLSSLAAVGISQVVTLGRVNGAAGALNRIFAAARLRALTMTCRTSVQINGPTYLPSGQPVGFPGAPDTVVMFMKGTCDSPNGFFETGDRVVATFPLTDQKVSFGVPTTVITAGLLTNNSLVLSWGSSSGLLVRDLWVDPTGSSFSAVSPTTNLDISISAGNTIGTSGKTRHSWVPDKGTPYLD